MKIRDVQFSRVIPSEVEGSEPALTILERRSDALLLLRPLRHPERKLLESKDLREAMLQFFFLV